MREGGIRNDEPEEWRPVVGVPGYEVSNLGNVRRPARPVKAYRTGKGYLRVWLHYRGKAVRKRVHRLVAEAFLGLRPDQVVRHKNDNPGDCRLSVLEVGSHLDNVLDAMIRGRLPHGERGPSSKLTDAIVAQMRELHAAGASIGHLARTYHVDHRTACDAIKRRTWKHVA